MNGQRVIRTLWKPSSRFVHAKGLFPYQNAYGTSQWRFLLPYTASTTNMTLASRFQSLHFSTQITTQVNHPANYVEESRSTASHKGLVNDTVFETKHTSDSKSNSLTNEALHTLPHPIWTEDELVSVRVTHDRPERIVDKLAFACVKAMRFSFDVLSGYALGRIDERGWLNRIVFLETVAGVPGMVGAMVRHLNSLRRMDKDYGWIHTLLEGRLLWITLKPIVKLRAENERMHLMTTLVLRKPSYLFRAGVLMTQGAFLSAFSVCYLLSHRFAHRFVAYLEEEAVVTYTKLLSEIDHGRLPLFAQLPAPLIARDYWLLPEQATFRDVVLAIRADENHHRLVNHTFAELPQNEYNPFLPGQ